MQFAAFFLPIAPLAVFVLVLRCDHLQASAPVFFSLMVAGMALAYACAIRGEDAAVLSAALGVLLSAAGLVAVIFEIDERLAAREGERIAIPTRPWLWGSRARRWRDFEGRFRAQVAFAGWATQVRRTKRRSIDHEQTPKAQPVEDVDARPKEAEALFSFERKGRSALFVFIRRDHRGHLLHAAAYDPEDYD